jgi:AcrR family transcriptional regulator
LSTISNRSTGVDSDQPAETPLRTIRADARRNRQKVLASARAVFAEAGNEAQVDDVARRAGVGIGTVYRHFPTKETLRDAVVLDGFEQLAERARRALDDPDPWRGLRDFMRQAVADFGDQRALGDVACMELTAGEGPLAACRDAASRDLAALLRRAQDAKVVRADVTAGDLERMLLGLTRTPILDDPDPVASRERWLNVILDGLRVRA